MPGCALLDGSIPSLAVATLTGTYQGKLIADGKAIRSDLFSRRAAEAVQLICLYGISII